MKKTKNTIKFAVQLIGVGIVCGVGYFYWTEKYITPIKKFGAFELGMTEAEATLAYGRKQDCPSPDPSDMKSLTFHSGGANCAMSAILLKQSDGLFKIVRICGGRFPPDGNIKKLHYENDFLNVLGAPTYVSVSADATTKILGYPDKNLAVEFQAGQILQWCVSTLPLKYN